MRRGANHGKSRTNCCLSRAYARRHSIYKIYEASILHEVLFFIGYKYKESRIDNYLRPLILDKRVATALRNRGDFHQPMSDSGWTGSQYELYLRYCHEHRPEDPEVVELGLFKEGR